MTNNNEIYRCNVCGNIVEVMRPGAGTLVCCGQPMELLVEKDVDSLFEKHVPVVEFTDGQATVKVGAIPHPMEDKHYIEWVEMISGENVFRKFLKPGEKPEASFSLQKLEKGGKIKAREYCNIHGLWKSAG